jgi:hypothetical protein
MLVSFTVIVFCFAIFCLGRITTAKLQLFFKTNKENYNIFQKISPPMTDDSDDKGGNLLR